VLPVPFGKSVRGRKCAAIGVLIVIAMASSLVTYLLGRVAVGAPALVCGGVSLACWLGAVGIYLWSLPTAVADFVEPRRG
jgi:hypothetical protein